MMYSIRFNLKTNFQHTQIKGIICESHLNLSKCVISRMTIQKDMKKYSSNCVLQYIFFFDNLKNILWLSTYWHDSRGFMVNFLKTFRTDILRKSSGWVLLYVNKQTMGISLKTLLQSVLRHLISTLYFSFGYLASVISSRLMESDCICIKIENSWNWIGGQDIPTVWSEVW